MFKVGLYLQFSYYSIIWNRVMEVPDRLGVRQKPESENFVLRNVLKVFEVENEKTNTYK